MTKTRTDFTPGPWRLKTYSQQGSMKRPEILGPPHPVDGGDYAPIAYFTHEADAQKATAAPEMYEALRVIANQSIGDDWTEQQALAFIKSHARAVLAKADAKSGY